LLITLESNLNQIEKDRENKMAVTFVKRSALPAAIKGKVGTLAVTITSNGQIQLSSLSTKFFGGDKKLVMGFDNGKVYLFKSDAKVVAKVSDADKIDIRYATKGGTSAFSGSAILRDANTFGTHLYDFKASGNQTFACTEDLKNGCLVFELPAGALTPKPVVHRAKKSKDVGTVANPGETAGTPLDTEELVLDAA
jgi:hypothetical protein